MNRIRTVGLGAVIMSNVAGIVVAAPPAAEQAAPQELPAAVITAARDESEPYEIPASAQVVGRKLLENRQARSVPESLGLLPAVAVQKTANSQGSPIIRGFTGYRTLALIDGIRYNNGIYRDGPNEYFSLIDTYAVENLELIQGPGSVLHGSDAVGGTVNVASIRSGFQEEDKGESFLHGSIAGRAQTAERSWQSRAEVDFGQGEVWGVRLGGTWKDFGDVQAADIGRQLRTGYTQQAFDVRLDYAPAENWMFTLAHRDLTLDDTWRTHATEYGVSFAGTEVGSDQRRVTDYRRSLSYARLRGTDLAGPVSSVQITASWQQLREDLDRVRSNGASERSLMEVGTLGLDAQFTSELPWGTLTWGADYYADSVDTSRTDVAADGTRKARIQGPVADDAEYSQLGIYARQEIRLGDRTSLEAGGRFTRVEADAGRYEDPVAGEASLSRSWQNAVGSLRLSHQLDAADAWRVYAGVSQAFRAPNLSDLTRLGASRSDEIESAATGLDPERFTSYEIGLKHRSESLSWSLAGWHTQMEDYIISAPTGRIIDEQRQITKQNAAEGWVQGVSVDVEWEASEGLTLFGSATWIQGEADAYTGSAIQREPVSRIPPLTVHYGVRWTSADARWWAELSGTTAAKADRLNSADQADTQRIPPGGTRGYTVLNLRAGWQATENITLYAGVENLLDEAWRTHGSGSNEPGIGGMFGVKLSF